MVERVLRSGWSTTGNECLGLDLAPELIAVERVGRDGTTLRTWKLR